MNSIPSIFDDQTVARILARVEAGLDETLEDLTRLVAIPSIAWPAFDQVHVTRSAEAVAELARKAGFTEVSIRASAKPDGADGSPAVIARIPAPAGKPTILLYAHHDVQPTGDEKLWRTDPFQATRVGERLFGRGAADDKAGVMVHIAALRALAHELAVGVTLFVEGEEEAGSPSFRNFLEENRNELAADVIVVADSGNWAAGTPALTTSLRGMASLEFEVRTLDHAVHSGMYGGAVPDAALAMLRLLATLHDEKGDVAVAGLAGSAPDPDVDYDREAFRRDSGVLNGVELIGSGKISSRVWSRPSITVIGMDIPDVAVSSNTLQAAMGAKLSVRIPPGISPESAIDAVKEHLTKHVPFGAQLSFGDSEGGQAWQANLDDPVVELARGALDAAWGQRSVTMGVGGSIPFIADLLELFPEASILVTGVEDPDARAHSANESLYLPDFRNAIVAEALLIHRLGDAGQE